MMMLPSETPPTSWEGIVLAILGTLGAGGALKFFAQWQAGKASIRAETATRVRTLEENVAVLNKQLGDLRESNGFLKAQNEALQKEADGLRSEVAALKAVLAARPQVQ